jgi:transcriptional regulator with XRE-family HTH domain
MYLNIKAAIMKRKEQVYENYYKGFGEQIKRQRKLLNLTQEYLSNGICSNTYVSKIENNKIAVKKEHLNLLMEKMGVSPNCLGLPEEMIEVLNKSLKYFYYMDKESYSELFSEIEDYENGVLIHIAKFGYYILTEDIYNASVTYRELFRYINSLEDYGFSVFIILSGYYNLLINDYQTARMLIESVHHRIINDETIYSLYYQLQFITYGFIHQFGKSQNALQASKTMMFNHRNTRRLNETMIYLNIFAIYENRNQDVYFDEMHLDNVASTLVNRYINVLITSHEHKEKYIAYYQDQDINYLIGLFLIAHNYLCSNDIDKYKEVKKLIEDKSHLSQDVFDLVSLLKMYEEKNYSHAKDYLINYLLVYFTRKQNIYAVKLITKEISKMLIEKSRYKDSITYLLRPEELKLRLQNEDKIE